MEILLIEDNLSIVEGLTYAFNKQDLAIVAKSCLKEAIVYINEHQIDLIILDVSLPDGNGFDLYRDVIKDKNIPLIFLTAKDDEDDIVMGLNLGADDYVTKPFSTKELIARVNRIILRNQKLNIIKCKDISFDLDKMEVYHQDELVELSSLELKILHLLFINIGKVVRRSTILDKIWEWTGNDVDDHSVTVYMQRIRRKLHSDIIVTIKGIGYRIDEE